ncbi:MAG TPA: adenylate/guanylate cyclase domain-containing protein [Alphaproteobacteria bacterium]|nr:adenylate/guanylate cyclase domain-containing protein [Alphaproteobacteria bacterium]
MPRPRKTSAAQLAARTTGLGHWLVAAAAARPQLSELHDAFCRELVARRLPIWRSTLGLELLHPELSGAMMVWTAGETRITRRERAGLETSPDYINSPTRIVDETDATFRRRLDKPAPEMPILESLRGQGATDYVMFPLPFQDRNRTAVLSFATTAKAGFTAADLTDLEMATALLAPYAERVVLRRLAIDLLDTYVGHHAGERIFAGRIERGKVETIEAAIWFCDMRGFTRFSDAAPRDVVVETLDAWFECMAQAVEDHDGQVLKFMGDGMLAIFPLEYDVAETCDRAVDAAFKAPAAVKLLNGVRAKLGHPPIAFGLALHFGSVSYGNIGGKRRLDFTVIGPAVNHASRLQELTKRLGHPVLASRTLAAGTSRPLVSLGSHTLRDIAVPEEIFALALPA